MLRLIRRAISPATTNAMIRAASTMPESTKVDRRASSAIDAASFTALSARSFSMDRYMVNLPVAAANQLSDVMPLAASASGAAPEAMKSDMESMGGGVRNGRPTAFACALACASCCCAVALSAAASLVSRSTSSGVPPEVYSWMAMPSR